MVFGEKRFYFEVRDYHSPLKFGDSLNGYLLEIIAVYNFETPNAFRAATRVPLYRFETGGFDIPLDSFDTIAQFTDQDIDALRAATLYWLSKTFGRSISGQSLGRLLAGALSYTFRYCVRCFREHPRAQLLWRFQAIKGCAKHRIRLIDRCWQCGKKAPLIYVPANIGQCPYCHADLCLAQIETLSEDQWHECVVRTSDILWTNEKNLA